MNTFTSRSVITILTIVLSGALDPSLLLAQAPQQPAQPENASAPQTQTQQSSPSDQTNKQQQQEDKASQGLINGTSESGTQLPESPDTVRARQQAVQEAQPPTAQPSGTAAAQGLRPVGTIASRPAGAAIAPAKQHRVRSFLIKFGAIAGAGAAIGTVVALSRAGGSSPPGSR
jgi:hypothetical protein